MATAEQISIRLAALEQARINLALAIKDATLNPRPEYEIDGQRFLWGDYLQSLNSQLEAIDRAIQRIGNRSITWLGTKKTINGVTY